MATRNPSSSGAPVRPTGVAAQLRVEAGVDERAGDQCGAGRDAGRGTDGDAHPLLVHGVRVPAWWGHKRGWHSRVCGGVWCRMSNANRTGPAR